MTCFPTAIGILIGLLIGLALLAWIVVRALWRDYDRNKDGFSR
jgi:hypothetical protein